MKAAVSAFGLFLGISHATFDPHDVSMKAIGHSRVGGLSHFFQDNSKNKNIKAVEEHLLDNSYSPEESSNHLRALKMPDNYIGVTYYQDDQCMQPGQQIALLLNYCANQISEEGVKRSVLAKLNKKQHTLVELDYEGYDCKGIPTKVIDLVKSFTPDFTMENDYGECYFDSFSGYYSTVDYHTTNPVPYPDGYAMTLSPEDQCSSTENTGYYQYYWKRNIPYTIPGCNMLDASVSGYFHSCSDGQVKYDVYSGSTCSGTFYGTYDLFERCVPQTNDDDGDDDDDDDVFDGYTYTDSFESTRCT
jgi:hypothetical protein